MGSSIRSRQITALKELINLNQSPKTTRTQEPVWKVLIYDRYGQDIISPLLTARELRELGVTLFLLLKSEREALPDVPAVYFALPTEENTSRLCEDISVGLYESYYLNFITALPRPQLEDISRTAVLSNCVSSVKKVYDQFLNFISLEDDLFVLRRHSEHNNLSYYAINKGDTTEQEMSVIIDEIVNGLFAVCVTLGCTPVIRCPPKGAAEMVCERLDAKIRENMSDARNNLFTSENRGVGQVNFHRPVLIVVERNMDMATALHHTWTYQALVHDVLELDSNRVVIQEVLDHGRKKRKEYDLNCSDKMWTAQKGSPFPEVAETIQEELEAYRAKEGDVKRLKQAMGLEAETDEAISMISDTTAKLTSTVSSLPELLETKRLIDMHTNIASAVLEHIKARKLDALFEAEEKIMNHLTPDPSLNDIINNPECGSKVDKIRTVLIHCICNEVSESEIDQYSVALEAAGCDLAPLKYIRRWRTFNKRMSRDQYSGGGTKTVNMFSKLLSHSSSLVMEGVKNLVIKKHNLPLTKIVDAIMEMKSILEVDDYRYFDPKLSKSSDNSVPRSKNPFYEAIVFVIGGGNYIEYQNLVDYRKGKSSTVPKHISYGSTELVNASQFLEQLAKLGV